jgi:hypothetical protein
MNFLQKGTKTLPRQFITGCQKIEEKTGCKCLVFVLNSHDIDRETFEVLCAHKEKVGSGDELNLIVQSYGGDLHSAYRIMKMLRKRFKKIRTYVPYLAKSAATFLAIASDEIVMGERGELGPMDSQHPSPADPEKSISALDSFKALESIRKFAFDSLDDAMLLITARSHYSVLEAFPHAIKFVGTIVNPLFGNFDVQRIGEYGKSLEVASEYCMRVMPALGYVDRGELRGLVNNLIWNYPSHGQVIDVDECDKLGLHARAADEDEESALELMIDTLESIEFIGLLDGVEKVKKDEKDETTP